MEYKCILFFARNQKKFGEPLGYMDYSQYICFMDVRLKIKRRLKEDGRNIVWLADKFEVSPNHLRMVLRCERPLSKANLRIAKDLWPDNDFSEESTTLKEKPLFKDDNSN